MAANKIYDSVPDATLVGSIILAYFLDRILPVATLVAFPASLIGWAVVAVGVGFGAYILAVLKSKRTSTDATGVPSEFITVGPYKFSRNPFYLSYVVIALGAAFAMGSLMAFLAPIICFSVLNWSVIPLEEKTLQKNFGHQYTRYKQSVRRWI